MKAKNEKSRVTLLTMVLILLALNILATIILPSITKISLWKLIEILAVNLALVGILFYFAYKRGKKSAETVPVEINADTVVEGMKKVFKIVTTEGQLQEIFNYEENKMYFKIIPNVKRALVVVKAKVLIGYDFEKFVWKASEPQKKITIISFPEPEIISLETDYKYYNIENNIFNPIKPEDINKIQYESKKQLENAVNQSGLKEYAASQMQTILTEIMTAYSWRIENTERIQIAPKQIDCERRML